MANFSFEIMSNDKDESNDMLVKLQGSLLHSTLTVDFLSALDSRQKTQILSANKVCVDFTEADKFDTAGLAWVMNLSAGLFKNKVSFSFRNIPDQLLNLASLSNAKELLTEYSQS